MIRSLVSCGMELAAGHALEFTVPKELRKTNPETRAVIDGTTARMQL